MQQFVICTNIGVSVTNPGTLINCISFIIKILYWITGALDAIFLTFYINEQIAPLLMDWRYNLTVSITFETKLDSVENEYNL